MNQLQDKILFIVVNTKDLQPDLLVRHIFDVNGGIVGSKSGCTWVLNSNFSKIYDAHFEVFYFDDSYCLKDLCGKTYVNGSDIPIGTGNKVRLNNKDVVVIGNYQIQVFISHDLDYLNSNVFLEEFFFQNKNEILDDLDFNEVDRELPDERLLDPLVALSYDSELVDSKDKILNELITSNVDVNFDERKINSLQSDSEFEISSSMRLKKILGFVNNRKSKNKKLINTDNQRIEINKDKYMDELHLESIEKELENSPMLDVADIKNQNHLIMAPILNGLQVQIGQDKNIEGMQKLSEEIGASLRMCIEGLLTIHDQVEKGRFGVINRNLQPIEDNPLRLGLDYVETMKTLFDTRKSLVHLSAPSAIEESLKNIRHHNQAMQEATSEALLYILNSFSPDLLLKRFNSYKRNTDNQEISSESWAWTMYQYYYDELTSNRQKGFDKLFWEVFEQSYDRKIREMQLER